MASLPPKPGTPPRLPDDRRPYDDRERRPAQPMAPRPYRDHRPVHDSERPFLPRRVDTYVPGGYDSRRDGDRRGYDIRDRLPPRDYDRERERRGAPREYNRSSPPPRWRGGSPDRDRRPYDRDRDRDRDRPPYRRPSPPPYRRGPPGRHDSRSPPRRRYSRSPRRYSSRSRSPRRSSPPASKRMRLGNHSIETSPRPYSPHGQSIPRSGERSLSPAKHHVNSNGPSQKEQESREVVPRARLPDTRDVAPTEDVNDFKEEGQLEQIETTLMSRESRQYDEAAEQSKPEVGSPNKTESTEVKVELESEKMQVDEHVSISHIGPALVVEKIEKGSPEVEDKIMIEIPTKPSPIPHTEASSSSHLTRSPANSPHYHEVSRDHRPIPTGPLRNRSGRTSPPPSTGRARSPPKGPRNQHYSNTRSINTQSLLPPTGPRDARRHNYQSTYSSPVSARAEHGGKLPRTAASASKYKLSPEEKDKLDPVDRELLEVEAELIKWPHRTTYTSQTLNDWKILHRALHELDMATLDLRVAETRREIAASQFEKAQRGCLGIDATDIPIEP